MGQPASADLIADLLLRYCREPMRYRAQAPRAIHLYGNLDVVLRLALGRPVAFVDPVLRASGTAELSRAAVFFIQHQFFRDAATHYDVLGLASDASPDEVRENFRLLMQLIHPDRQGVDAIWPDSYAARANRAHAALKSFASRTDYDRQLNAAHAREAYPHSATIVAGMRGPARIVANPRGRVRMSVLPEWWTAGVGGFVRGHPRLIAFTVLVVVSLLAIVLTFDTEREGVFSQESGGHRTPPPPASRPAERSLAGVRRSPADGASTPSAAIDTREGATLKGRVSVARTVEAQAPRPDSTATTPQPAIKVEVTPVAVATAAPVGAKALPVTLPSAPPGAPESLVARSVRLPSPVPPPAPAPTGESAAAPRPGAVVPMEPATSSVAADVPVALPAMPAAAERRAGAIGPPPESAEVEALIAAFVSSYEKGLLDTFSRLFDDDAQAGQQHGRTAIAIEYDHLFRSTAWRHIAIFQLGWRPVGDHTEAKGEFLMKTGWRDGREVEQRMVVDMELVRQSGRAVIARLSLRPL